jgi:dihydrofolate reductase
MRRLVVFNQLSVDGYFTDAQGDMSWAKEGVDDEFNRFTMERAQGGGVLLFGRVTYELMESFWPTPNAARTLPTVAKQMNTLPKVVFSRTMTEARWNNTKLVKNDLEGTIRRMKAETGPGIAIMGSGTIVSQLAETGLIDAYELIINPVALGAGRTIFDGIRNRVELRLAESRTFKNGKVFLCYAPRRAASAR